MSEKKTSKRNGRPTATAAAKNGNGNGSQAEFAASVVEEITRSNTALARAGAETLVAPADVKGAAIANGAADGVAASSNITDEQGEASVAFGAFVKNVGLAVAAAQAELDATLVKTAEALSKATIDVVHTFEQQLDDEGRLQSGGEAKIQSLPLANYVMPTAYQWSRVYLEADMKVQEFNSKTGFDIMSKTSSGGLRLGGGFGMGGWSANGGFGYGSSSNQTSVQNGYSMDNAAGSMHMEATLEPRADIELPKPLILQKGPVMTATVTGVQEIPDPNPPANTTAKVIGKEATILVTVKKANNTANNGKTLQYSVDQPNVTHKPETSLTTDAQGQIKLIVTRKGAAYDPLTPIQVNVVVWLGMVSQSVSFTL